MATYHAVCHHRPGALSTRERDVGVLGSRQRGQLHKLHHRAVLADVQEGDLALVLPLVGRQDGVDSQLGLLAVQGQAAPLQELPLCLAEVDDRAVDEHPPVLFVPLDGVEIPAAGPTTIREHETEENCSMPIGHARPS